MLDTVLNFLSNGLTHAGWVGMLVYLLVATQLTIFTVTLYLHRSQTHRGVDFHPALARARRAGRARAPGPGFRTGPAGRRIR